MDEELFRAELSPEAIGKRVYVVPLNERGESLQEDYGWLESYSDEGITYRRRHYIERTKTWVRSTRIFLPRDRVGYITVLDDQEGWHEE